MRQHKAHQTSLTAIDLFSGCGGMTLGLRKAGFRVIGAVEFEDLAAETYSKNHPQTHLWHSDIRKLDGTRMKKELGLKKGQLDLLVGCPPCQGFSTMRTLNGAKDTQDPRNDLIFEFLRLIKAFLPRAIMMENVPGLAKDQRLTKMVNALKRLNYSVKIEVLDAADFGVPQRRRRLILVACRDTQSVPISIANKSKKRKTVRDVIGNCPKPGETGDPCHDLKENRSAKIWELIKSIPKDGGSRKDLLPHLQLKCHEKCNGFKDVYGRMAWDRVAPTITGGCVNPSKGRFLHPSQNRTITLREAALLQTFPRTYFFSMRSGKFPAAQMIGNALPPEFIRLHAKNIKEMLIANRK